MKLDIQLFASGTINGSSTASNCDCRIIWNSTGDSSTNSSSVTASVQIYRSGSSSTKGTFSGSLTINGTKYPISKKFNPYNWGSWATVGTIEVTIEHDSDGTKTIPIKCSLTQTGTSMAGTYSASGTAVLDTLHKAPVLNSVTIVEANQDLVNAGINDDYFVLGLSQKQFTINATYEDNAIYDHTTIINQYGDSRTPQSTLDTVKTQNINVLNTTNNILNTSNVKLKNYIYYDDNQETTYGIKFKSKIYDSLGGSTENDYTIYDYKTYNKVTINGTAKRDGQTSGNVKISCNGTFFNGIIGNVNHSISSYKPTISYKFYEVGDEENAIVGIVPDSSITVNDGTFSVSNYEIGSSDTSASNYFDYEKAYRVVIGVQDDFTGTDNQTHYFSSAVTSELSISVGVALWTEFKNRTDFARLTIGNKPIIVTDNFVESVSTLNGNSNTTLTYNIAKTNYTPVGIVGYSCSNYALNVYILRIEDSTTATVNIRNITSSAVSNPAVRIYVIYIKN